MNRAQLIFSYLTLAADSPEGSEGAELARIRLVWHWDNYRELYEEVLAEWRHARRMQGRAAEV